MVTSQKLSKGKTGFYAGPCCIHSGTYLAMHIAPLDLERMMFVLLLAARENRNATSITKSKQQDTSERQRMMSHNSLQSEQESDDERNRDPRVSEQRANHEPIWETIEVRCVAGTVSICCAAGKAEGAPVNHCSNDHPNASCDNRGKAGSGAPDKETNTNGGENSSYHSDAGEHGSESNVVELFRFMVWSIVAVDVPMLRLKGDDPWKYAHR